MTITVRLLGPSDGAVLRAVAPDVFDDPVDPRWSTEFLADPRHHLAVAIDQADGGWVVGMASAVHYVHPDKPPELWINEVGVSPSHQGRGIATRLLRALLDHARTLGCVQAWVLTERDNTVAQRLYAGAGGAVADSRPVMYEFDIPAR